MEVREIDADPPSPSSHTASPPQYWLDELPASQGGSTLIEPQCYQSQPNGYLPQVADGRGTRVACRLRRQGAGW